MIEKQIVGNEMLLGEVCSLLSEGKRVKLRAKGNSMQPFIYSGDILVLRPASEFSNGEIVLARTEEKRYVVHRVVGLTPTHLILMGDGNIYGKEYCRREDVFGTVTYVIRNGHEISVSTHRSYIKTSCRRILLRMRQRMINLKKRLINR